MALADRHYMRDEGHSPRWTTILIVVLIGCFAVQAGLLFYADIDLSDHLALSIAGLSRGKIWQFLTFQFLHACPWPWHVLFNCLGLYFFGRPVEEALGSKRFLTLYLLAGVAGGVLQVLLTALLPRHPDIPMVGASAGVCGLIAIFCTLNPMQELTTWIYFLPITIRARYFLMFLGLYSLFGAFIPFDHVAHGAHLGGILLGIGYVRWRHAFSAGFSQWGFGRGGRALARSETASGRSWRRGATATGRKESVVFISDEVDPILDKISAHGIDSLTERERKILDAARKKMGGR